MAEIYFITLEYYSLPWVGEEICKLVKNPKFEEQIRKKIGVSLDMREMDKEYENMNAQRKQFVGAKNKLAQQMDHLSISDKHYDKKYQDMQERMDALYDEIDKIEESMNELEQRMLNIKQQVTVQPRGLNCYGSQQAIACRLLRA